MKKILIADDYTVWASRVAGYLTKPIDFNRLKAITKRSLANRTS